MTTTRTPARRIARMHMCDISWYIDLLDAGKNSLGVMYFTSREEARNRRNFYLTMSNVCYASVHKMGEGNRIHNSDKESN